MSLYGHSFNDFRTQTNNDIVEAHTDKPAHECGACRGSGWWLSDYDTWERCPIHYTGQDDPETSWSKQEVGERIVKDAKESARARGINLAALFADLATEMQQRRGTGIGMTGDEIQSRIDGHSEPLTTP